MKRSRRLLFVFALTSGACGGRATFPPSSDSPDASGNAPAAGGASAALPSGTIAVVNFNALVTFYAPDDPSTGRVYVGAIEPTSVSIFDDYGLDAGGSFPAMITGDQTILNSPYDVAVDHAGRILVANDLTGLVIFAPGSTGNVAPVAILPPVSSFPADGAYSVAIAP